MNIEKVIIAVIFDKVSESEDEARLYYHRTGEDIDSKRRSFSATVVIKDKNLLKNLKKLKAGTEIEIETQTDFSREKLETELIDVKKYNEIVTARKAVTGELAAI